MGSANQQDKNGWRGNKGGPATRKTKGKVLNSAPGGKKKIGNFWVAKTRRSERDAETRSKKKPGCGRAKPLKRDSGGGGKGQSKVFSGGQNWGRSRQRKNNQKTEEKEKKENSESPRLVHPPDSRIRKTDKSALQRGCS